MKSPHIPVLLNAVLKAFSGVKEGVIVDCTLGYGGHSDALLKSNPNIEIIACDRDEMALNFCQTKFNKNNRIKILKANFGEILTKIETKNVAGILADIGVSSLQLDLDERGFSIFSQNLDMRMDKSQNLDAKIVVNSYSLENLAEIFHKYGELKNAKILAEKIVKARQIKPILSAKELAKILGNKNLQNRSISAVKLAFQAIRIEVNKELLELENLLLNIENSTIKSAIIAIISFHSLEDRIVKQKFKMWEKNCKCPPNALKCECGSNHKIGKILTKKPIIATSDEIAQNSRSSCAKLRIFELLR